MREYNALGDGVSDDTAAIASCIAAAFVVQGAVYFPAGRYVVSNINFPNGIRQVFGPGVIVDSAASGAYDAVVTLGGSACISGTGEAVNVLDWCVSIEVGHDTTLRALACGALINSRIHDMILSWGPTIGAERFGIDLRWITGAAATNNVIIQNNIIVAPQFSDYTGRFAAITLIGNSTAYGGYFSSGTGDTADPTMPVANIVITGNVISGGSHGITLNGVQNCAVVGNVIQRTKHRGIIMEPVSTRNTISGNTIRDYGSSAILLAFGCSYNTISGNECYTIDETGEGAIQAYCGCHHNLITGNNIHSYTHYGIYAAVGAQFNTISGNRVSGYRLAGIAIENDWNSPLPPGADYSRPNFGAPPSPYTNYAFSHTQGNIISNNFIGDPRSALDNACAIYLAQINGYDGATKMYTYYNEVAGNVIQPYIALKYDLCVFEEESAHCVLNTFRLNTIYGFDSTRVSWTRYRNHFRLHDGNEALNVATGKIVVGPVPFLAFHAGDATPDVSFGESFETANSSDTTITAFDNGVWGQEITLRLDAHTGIAHNASAIVLQGGHLIAAGTRTNGDLIRFKNIGGIWYEVWRNWASAPEPVAWKTFTASDTTPSVAWPGLNYQTNNSSSTTITDFDDGVDGQDLIVKLDVNTGIAHNANSIRLKNSASIAAGEVDANFLIGFVRNSGIWFEIWRRSSPPEPAAWRTFAAGDTTPEVAWPGRNFQTNNSSSTSITYFDGGVDGQEITVRLDVNTGITHNANFIRLKSSTSIAAGEVNANFLIGFVRLAGIWFETWRDWPLAPDAVAWRTFSATDTTPDVTWPGRNFQANNSSSTTITYFDGGVEGQEIVVRLDGNTGITHDSSSIRLKDATSITAGDVNTNCLIGFIRLADIWFEQWRNW